DPCSSVFICGLLFLSVFVGVHLWPAFLYPCSSVFICGLYLWLSPRFEHYRGAARAVAGQSRVGAEVERTAQPVGALVGGIEIAEPDDQRGGRADAIERDLHRAAGAQSGTDRERLRARRPGERRTLTLQRPGAGGRRLPRRGQPQHRRPVRVDLLEVGGCAAPQRDPQAARYPDGGLRRAATRTLSPPPVSRDECRAPGHAVGT